jgi:hypothetical protein
MAEDKGKDKSQTADGAADAPMANAASIDADASATYAKGTPGIDPNVAVQNDAPLISTYSDALEAGYFGMAAGHANTAKMSVAAVTERDRAMGLPGTKGMAGASVNGAGKDAKDAPAGK